IPRELLERNREGIIVGSACESGELYEAVVAGRTWSELKKLARFYDYLEIQPTGNNEFLIREGKIKNIETIQEFNRTIIRLGQAENIPVVATCDVHFLDPRDEVYRRILMAGQNYKDADIQAPLYLRTTDEMLEEFAYLGPEKAYEIVVKNTNIISDMCEDVKPLVDGTYPPSIEGSAEDLERICYEGAYKLYGNPLPEEIEKRIEAELKPIIKNGFDVMYMAAQKLIEKSNEAGYLVGSRGSVGSSVVAYFCGITEVNPLPPHYICDDCKMMETDYSGNFGCGADMPDKFCPKCGKKYRKDGFNIPFFTFLGFNAEKEPDIDLNFSGEYQLQAHADAVELFGEEQVFKAGTIGTIADKTAYGFVRKYADERGLNLSKAELNRLTIGCTGVKRTTGQHPGGLIIVPRDKEIYDFCPVQHPADDKDSGVITTHFEFKHIHENLLKLDMLGHDNPTIIKHLEDMTGVDAKTIQFDDPATIGIFTDISYLGIASDDILGKTGAAAVPEFGTRFARQMLLDTKPTNFDGLVRISGLSHGTDVWMGNAADLIRAGTATLNEVISARDDITMFLISKGMDASLSFKTSEAIRKGKGIVPETIEIMKDKGIPDWYIESCIKIKYLYPKAHAVAYVMMAFKIAWFKVHYPLPFYSAYFTIRAVGFDSSTMTLGIDTVRNMYNDLDSREDLTANEKDILVTLEVVYEFYKRGFDFLEVDIYKSDAERFIIEGNSLRPPLNSLPGLGATAANDIVRERENGEFYSIDEIIRRCPKVGKSVVELLKSNGAIGDLPDSDQLSMF
ncbi:MAG: PolC-type DNA polymerase III, partial [Clostridiales bacterium]|nr:PolC-type DNA polymerase III [Clostridiales bacterium]